MAAIDELVEAVRLQRRNAERIEELLLASRLEGETCPQIEIRTGRYYDRATISRKTAPKLAELAGMHGREPVAA